MPFEVARRKIVQLKLIAVTSRNSVGFAEDVKVHKDDPQCGGPVAFSLIYTILISPRLSRCETPSAWVWLKGFLHLSFSSDPVRLIASGTGRHYLRVFALTISDVIRCCSQVSSENSC
jgi:hypothetical protein